MLVLQNQHEKKHRSSIPHGPFFSFKNVELASIHVFHRLPHIRKSEPLRIQSFQRFSCCRISSPNAHVFSAQFSFGFHEGHSPIFLFLCRQSPSVARARETPRPVQRLDRPGHLSHAHRSATLDKNQRQTIKDRVENLGTVTADKRNPVVPNLRFGTTGSSKPT